MFKKIIIFSLVAFVFLTGVAVADAATGGVKALQDNLTNFGGNTGLGDDADLKTKIASIVNIVLGFVGLISTIVIIYAGFRWMTAGGNEEQIKEAKGHIRNAVIGIVVVLLSYTIINFAVSRVSDVTGAGGGGGGDGGDVIEEPVPDPTFTQNPTAFDENLISSYRFCEVGIPSNWGMTCDARYVVCAPDTVCDAITNRDGLCIDNRIGVQNTNADKDACRNSFIDSADAIQSGG